MENYKIYIILAVIVIVAVIVKTYCSHRFINKLSKLLYEDMDGEKYLAALDSFEGRFFLNRKKRIFMRVDGYALLDDAEMIEKTFEELDKTKLSYGSKIGLLQKEINYYVKVKHCEKANQLNKEIQSLGSQIKDEAMADILFECNAIVEINCNHNGDLAKAMVEKGDNSQAGMIRALYYYRAAKCYYFKNDKEKMHKYLKEAQLKAPNTAISKQAEACEQDATKFEDL